MPLKLLYKINKRVRGLCKLISLINGSSISPSTPPVHLTTAAANESKLGTYLYLSVLYVAGISNSTTEGRRASRQETTRGSASRWRRHTMIPFVAGEVSSTLHVERRHQPSQQSHRKRAHQVFRYWRLQRLRLFRRVALELKTVSYCARCAVEDDRRLKVKLTCETHMSASGKSSSRGILGHTEGAYAYDAT